MKRRNAETGKLRRPMKRTKITEGMYGNSMLYVKFILLWSSIALADYMLEFRFEFLWPLWLMIKAIYHCYCCKGLAFTIFFTCIAVTSDLVCYLFVPMQMLTYLAGVYVWVNSIWNTFESKGVCAQTIMMWMFVVYAEALRTGVIGAALSGSLAPEPDEWAAKPWVASALGFPIVSLGVSVKDLLDEKLRLRTQRQVREQNEFYFRLMREALPEDGVLSTSYSSSLPGAEPECVGEVKQNGTSKRRCKTETNGHVVRDKEYISLQAKLEHLEQYVEKKNRVRDSSTQSTQSQHSQKSTNSVQTCSSVQTSAQPSPHAGHSNGVAKGPGCAAEDTHNYCKGTAKSTKCDKKEPATLKEDRRRKKHRDLDKENNDSHKSKENTKEQIDKDLESTKECNNINKEEEKRRDEERKREKEEERKREKEEEKKREEERRREKEEERRQREEERRREREEERRKREEERRQRDEEKRREKERERELKEREREREKEREKERERERELLSARESAEELSRLRAALAASQRGEAEATRLLAAADKQRRTERADLKQQLQHKMSTWRCGERAALERKLGEEKRLRLAAEQQLLKERRTPQGECDNDWCKTRRAAAEAEAATLRKDLQRTRERLAQAQHDLTQANEQVATLEAEKSSCLTSVSVQNGAAFHALQSKALHLERVLSDETRVKLDLLSALGDANRKMHNQERVMNRQEKELEELKVQMLAVMPAEYVTPSSNSVSKMRLSGGSPLDPNATVYTPKQLCLDA